MFQQIYCSTELLQKLYSEMPAHRFQKKHLGLKEGDDIVFQCDAVTYHIRVGERKFFPDEVARMIVKQSTYIVGNPMNGEPLSFCVPVGETSQGTFNPLACPAVGCKFLASNLEVLAKHLLRQHTQKKEAAQNAAIAQGVADLKPGTEDAAAVESEQSTT